MPQSQPYPGTQAVQRALSLLKAFSDEQPDMSLDDLARQAQLNKTTAFRLLTALESEGLVARTPNAETYRLGPEIVVLGARALRANDLRSAGRDELERLAQATRETVTLEVLLEGDVLILDEVLSSYLLGATQSLGTRWPAYATSTGKALLAFLPASGLEEHLSLPLQPFTPHTITDLDRLKEELACIRREGYAVARAELEEDYVAVGAPIFNYDSRVVAAISAAGPANRLTPERVAGLIPLVCRSAEKISKRLGYSGPETG
jgi:DNA-binding IclR family transcriptional regulator